MKTRYGCLTLLLLFAAITAPGVWFAEDPGQSSALAVGGFLGLLVIYVHSGFEWLMAKFKQRRQLGPPLTAGRPAAMHNQPLLWTGPRRVGMLFYSSARLARRLAGHRASSVMRLLN